MEDKPVCPFQSQIGQEPCPPMYYAMEEIDNLRIHLKMERNQITALQAQLADLRRAANIPDDWSFEDAKDALESMRIEADALTEVSNASRERFRENRKLQAQVEGMREVVKLVATGKCCIGLVGPSSVAHVNLGKAQALLSATPAGDLVVVKREDLETVLYLEDENWRESTTFNRLKAALEGEEE